MIPNKRPASEYRVRTLDRNDLNEKGKIYIGKGGTTTVDGVAGVSDITAKNIITAINENATDKTIEANILSGKNGIVSNGDIKSTKHSIMVVDTNGTPLAKMDGDGNISAQSFDAKSDKRLKENIVEYSPNKSILDLPIYSYNFISDEKKIKKIGCLAQDLKEICPEIVKEDDNGYLSIEENKVVYLLLDEVKKLKKRVDELEVRNGD